MEIDAPTNVLVLAPSHSDAENATCVDLLTSESSSQVNVLSVTLTQSPDDRLEIWRDRVGGASPANVSFVDVGDPARSAGAPAVTTCETPGTAVSVEAVSSPKDLTSLGVAITNTLSRWADDDNQTVVCFHSVTALLQYVELRRVFQFLHVLTRSVNDAGAIAHYHLDPTVHDAKTINTIRTLVDAVVESDDGVAVSPDPRPSTEDVSREEQVDRAIPDGDVLPYRATYDDREAPAAAIVHAVAEVEGVDPTDLESPLFDWIETDALDALLRPPSTSAVDAVRVEFTWDQYQVEVDHETITVRRAAHD